MTMFLPGHAPYLAQFSYSVGGNQFFYSQNLLTKKWSIHELLPGGKMGARTANGSWGFSYRVQFPVEIGIQVFVYGQNLKDQNWFIQELLPGGEMG